MAGLVVTFLILWMVLFFILLPYALPSSSWVFYGGGLSPQVLHRLVLKLFLSALLAVALCSIIFYFQPFLEPLFHEWLEDFS